MPFVLKLKPDFRGDGTGGGLGESTGPHRKLFFWGGMKCLLQKKLRYRSGWQGNQHEN